LFFWLLGEERRQLWSRGGEGRERNPPGCDLIHTHCSVDKWLTAEWPVPSLRNLLTREHFETGANATLHLSHQLLVCPGKTPRPLRWGTKHPVVSQHSSQEHRVPSLVRPWRALGPRVTAVCQQSASCPWEETAVASQLCHGWSKVAASRHDTHGPAGVMPSPTCLYNWHLGS
jgi:hypothetical protein